ncbi:MULTISPECIES: phage portal protein [Nocardiaceae]|uniref:phage portal protein n=1 Tax=Nocardiaceae TaxID=85025 RepID=UPI00068ED54A|nr:MULTISPECIES: phage portal protein [Rhodococcus]
MKIDGLVHSEQNTLDELWKTWQQKLVRNQLRSMYYDAKNLIRDLGIAIPPDLVNLDMVLGWPAKSVDGLSRRCKLDGFVVPGLSTADLGIDDMWTSNRMATEVPQAHTSAFLHSCAFVSTTLGDVQSGEPDVIISTRSAMYGSAIWDKRRRQVSSHLAIIEADELSGAPSVMIMYLPDSVVTMTKTSTGWRVDRRNHALKRVPVEVLAYHPRLDRPFGSSRISRPVMTLADSALRTAVRMEVSAEFYSAPQRWIMGADESAFMDADGNLKTQWQAIMGRIWAVGATDDGDLPTVGEFSPASQLPHADHLRTLATQFSGETSIPVGSLGVIQDNPSSAEAIHAAKEDLLIEAEFADDQFGHAWTRSLLTGVQIRDNLSEIPTALRAMRAKWRDPATPSRSSAADAVLKTVQAFPWLAESEVALEQLGWDETTIARAMADKRRMDARSMVRERITSRAAEAQQDPEVADLANRTETETDADVA